MAKGTTSRTLFFFISDKKGTSKLTKMAILRKKGTLGSQWQSLINSLLGRIGNLTLNSALTISSTFNLLRIGNLLVPNNNYVKFEEWLMPILDKLLEEQNKNGVVWTPSKIIHRLLNLTFLNLFWPENIRLL